MGFYLILQQYLIQDGILSHSSLQKMEFRLILIQYLNQDGVLSHSLIIVKDRILSHLDIIIYIRWYFVSSLNNI